MNRELICVWLNLSSSDWPPDHYALLGLQRGETDRVLIEKHVHERLARLRCYQLSQPEQASAAMNLLAQAFSCLTNPVAKQLYDAQLPGAAVLAQVITATAQNTRESEIPTERMEPIAIPTVASAVVAGSTIAVELLPAEAVVGTQIDWQTAAAPPVRMVVSAAPPATQAPSAVVQPEPVDPLAREIEYALASRAARRGLATRRQLFERVWLTRQLVREWQLIGKTLARLGNQPRRPADEADLGEGLHAVAEYLRDFPRLLGRPGMPGYRVTALRRQRPMCKAIQELEPEQRKTLVKDWLAGHTLLLGYRRTLLRELRRRRRSSGPSQAVATTRAWISDNAGMVLTVLGVAVLIVLVCVLS
jgi:hypothetical protein